MQYKASYADLSYQGRQIITCLRRDGQIVEILRVACEERNSYQEVTKTVTYSRCGNLEKFNLHDPFGDCYLSESLLGSVNKWSEEHCPPLYVGRKDIYSKEDVEHPLYIDLMKKITWTFNPFMKHFFGREITQRGGLNGLCLNIVITDFNEDECKEIDGFFARALNI